ncbi:MAG: HmuY family protein [Flavobacteriaceae bacterium]
MKATSFFMLLLFSLTIFTSCDTDDDSPQGVDSITFTGTFSRQFEVQGAPQRATYIIAEDKVSYTLTGGVGQADYELDKLYFSKGDNRWIGHRKSNDTYYVMFFKDISDTKISLYKKEVASLDAGKSEPVPAADNTENHGWNNYEKDLPISAKIENLYAPQTGGQGQGEIGGPFVKFSFEEGKVIDSDTKWDIAFRGTTIAVNGGVKTGTNDEPERNGNAGAAIASGTFDDIGDIDGLNFEQDAEGSFAIPTGSGNGWYTYTGPPSHQIVPTAGKILVFRTHDGKYAKIEVLSYYKDADASSESRHYTFKYVYQPNGEVTTF